MPNYYSTSEELRALRNENAELKARLKKLELKDTSFVGMSHSQLMKFFVENFAEYSYDERGLRDAGLTELYEKWQTAYKPFKQKRDARKVVISTYLKEYFANKTDRVLVQSEVVKEVMPKIKEIYFDITPFDCEDEKWTGCYSNQSWENRIHSFFSDEARKNGIVFYERLVAVKYSK